MFSYGTLTPATYNSVGSTPPTPSYNYIWAATPTNNYVNTFMVSYDGTNWVSKSTGISGGINSYAQYDLNFNQTTKELIKLVITNSSGTSGKSYSYSPITNSGSAHNMPTNYWGSYTSSFMNNGSHINYDNSRNLWEAVYPSSNSSYGGAVGKNSSLYLTNQGSSVLKKLQYNQAKYTIVSGGGDLFIYPINGNGYVYYLASGRDFTGGTYQNFSTAFKNAQTAAGLTSDQNPISCVYAPNIGYVFVTKRGSVVYNTSSGTFTAQSTGWQWDASYSMNRYMMCYEPARQRIYLVLPDAIKTGGAMTVYYSQDGLNWYTLGNIGSSLVSSNNKSIAADCDKVIVCSGSNYGVYTYNTDTWTFNSGITFPTNQSFRSVGYIFCYPYTND